MSAITPKALALLFRVKGDNEMIYVQYKDGNDYVFSGRILDVDTDTFGIEATDGEVVRRCSVYRIVSVDVRPFQRFNGYSTTHFVSDFGAGVA